MLRGSTFRVNMEIETYMTKEMTKTKRMSKYITYS
jgi:hypothetical protein